MKKAMLFVSVVIASGIFVGCEAKQEEKKAANPEAAAEKKMDMPVTKEEDKFSKIEFANSRDFICNMPVSAGVNDTAQYKGKVYGFCATECKEEFLKDPESHLAKK